MKIIIRAPNWLGDDILSLPALESVKKNFPEAKIWIAARDWVQDLYQAYNFIEEVIPLPALNNLNAVRESAKMIKQHKFDAGLLFTNSFSSALLFYLAKIPQRWGYSRDFRGFLLTRSVSQEHQNSSSHQVDYYLNLIKGLGLKAHSPELSLPLSPEEKNEAKNKLLSLGYNPQKPLAIISPGASYGPAKRWPASRFARLASMLQEKKKAEILIVGASQDKELGESISSSMNQKPINLVGKTRLRELAAMSSIAGVFITNDSGPMHMANALKTPVVAIFGPTDPRVTGPYQQPSTFLKKDVPCWPCSYRKCPFDHRCMMQIETEEVFTAAEKYLQ